MKNGLAALLVLFGAISSSFAEVTALTAAEAAIRVSAKGAKVVVVDVRTPKEFAEGHIAGAINIDVRAKDFEEKLGKLDREKVYLFHCKSGGRSTVSIEIWERLGFKKLLHLDSGILEWKKAGLELVVPGEEKSTE